MASHVALLLVVLVGIAGCYEAPSYPFRGPCPQGETCCPPGSHEEIGTGTDEIICALDEPPCGDAGADGGACQDAGPDAP